MNRTSTGRPRLPIARARRRSRDTITPPRVTTRVAIFLALQVLACGLGRPATPPQPMLRTEEFIHALHAHYTTIARQLLRATITPRTHHLRILRILRDHNTNLGDDATILRVVYLSPQKTPTSAPRAPHPPRPVFPGARFVGATSLTPAGRALLARLEHARDDDITLPPHLLDPIPRSWRSPNNVSPPRLPSTAPRSPLRRLIDALGPTERGRPDAIARLLRRLVDPTRSPTPTFAKAFARARAAYLRRLDTLARRELHLAHAFLLFARRLGRKNLRPQILRARFRLSPAAAEVYARRLAAASSSPSAAPSSLPTSRSPQTLPTRAIAHTPPTRENAQSTSRPVLLPLVLRAPQAYLRQVQATDLRKIHDVASLHRVLAEAEPQHPQYRALLGALARYRALVAQGGWPLLRRRRPRRLRRGLRRRAVATLRRRLTREGYLPAATPRASNDNDTAPPNDDARVDERLIEATRAFQRAHGLRVTRRLDRAFYAALNISATARLAAIHRAIAAWRASSVGATRPYIWVNIPAYHLEVIDGNKRLARHRIIVGRARGTRCDPETQRRVLRYATPIQDARLQSLIFAPYWNVTATIKQRELDPERAKDSLFYEKNGYEILNPGTRRERVRQLPGPQNSLGFVKFIFPNPYATFIHDTPEKRLFERRRRDFSHGCMRVEDAWSLAKVILSTQGQWHEAAFRRLYDDWMAMAKLRKLREVWDPDLYEALVEEAAKLRREIFLHRPIAVHVAYRRVRVDATGQVQFLPDIYGREGERSDRLVGRRCVPERKLARRGFADIPRSLADLETRAKALAPDLARARLIVHLLSRRDRRRHFWLVREIEKKLDHFAERHASLARTIRDRHAEIETLLATTGRRWRTRLVDRAVDLNILLGALKAMTVRAERDSKLAAKLAPPTTATPRTP